MLGCRGQNGGGETSKERAFVVPVGDDKGLNDSHVAEDSMDS